VTWLAKYAAGLATKSSRVSLSFPVLTRSIVRQAPAKALAIITKIVAGRLTSPSYALIRDKARAIEMYARKLEH
jgi:hypothetical protein